MKTLDEAMREAARAMRMRSLWPGTETHVDRVNTERLVEAIRALDAAGFPCVSRSPLLAAKNLAIALAAGSCSCGIKSPDAALHALECRYRLAVDLIENIEDALVAAAPKPGDAP